jgi:hypothetical protein
MLGIWAEHAAQYLLVLAIVTTLVFALPIFAVPLTWSRLMLWKVPEDTDLTVYFGRCLGAFILIIEAMMFRAALTGEAIHVTFELLAAVAVMMIVVHVYGAFKRIQPITETLEIGFYAGLLILTLMFWPGV